MTHVFLSFAADDSAVATGLAQHWELGGHTVYYFTDPTQRGKRFTREIARQIAGADVFVALMSPAFLNSKWCRREVDMAIEREHDMAGQFVYVLSVAAVDRRRSDYLSSYDWIPARSPLSPDQLGMITTRITGTVPAITGQIAGFRNRTDELAKLRHALVTVSGQELWTVAAPPLMGKSWLLTKLSQELAEVGWSVHRLDLRGGSTNLRADPAALVAALFRAEDLPLSRSLDVDDLRKVAASVGSEGSKLFVLDGAELLAPAYLTTIRRALTTIHRLAKQTGTGARIGLVIGTRRQEDWQGIITGIPSGGRFQEIFLTEFGVDVVEQQLLDRTFGQKELTSHAERLHRMSEGLPALLIRCIDWAKRTGFLFMDRCENPTVFAEVANDYIEHDLLGAESLLPDGAPRLAEALAVLTASLRTLCTFRLYTQSHLTHLVDTHAELASALADALWDHDDLWEAMRHTALHTQKNSDEIWHELEPALRRLLFRYHHPDDDARSAAHAAAVAFYQRWSNDWAAGREQQAVLVECIWHEASRLMIEQPDDLPRLLPTIATDLARDCGTSPMYRPAELRLAVTRRLRGDRELQTLLSSHEGLFDEIVKYVELTIREQT